MLTYNTLVVLLGTSLLGAAAGLVGSYAVLRRRSLTGDALAHAALPGLCLAFLIRGERSLPWMLFGALLSGLAGLGVISALRRWTRIKEDAAIGIVLSVFFGAGITLSRSIQNLTDTGSKAGLDSYIFGKTAGILWNDVLLIAGTALACLIIIQIFYKQFLVLAFDPDFAKVQGWPLFRLDMLLMGLIAIVVTIGLPMVGVVLMASLLILPGAAARFWTERLSTMLWLSAIFGLAIGCCGTTISTVFYLLPAGPLIVLTGTAVFLVSLCCAPRRGVFARWYREWALRLRLQREAALRLIYEGQPLLVDGAALHDLRRNCLATWSHPPELTIDGRAQAAEIVRLGNLRDLVLSRHGEWVSCLTSFDGAEFLNQLPPEIVAQLESELSQKTAASTN